MFLTEWDQEKVLAQLQRDTERRTNERVARTMLMENYPLSAIVKISKLSEEVVRKLAETLGVQLT
ncbi:MAG: hypothetical protein IJQ56_10625 [Synergistaceae bacterium]|nr:hypothetical protein [Synergistaceae bacterium]